MPNTQLNRLRHIKKLILSHIRAVVRAPKSS